MSNERKNRENDPLVADTYTALAQERAPDRLNKRVLRMAAREARTPYSRARAWMRPAAWAATIGLSLAIVLELTRLPQPEQDAVSMDAFTPKDMAVLREADERARAQSGAKQVPATPSLTPRSDALVAPDEEVSAGRVNADPSVPARSEKVDQDRAGGLSSRRPAAEPVLGTASLAATAEKKAAESGFTCTETARESAESWMACIKQLRKNGQQDLADSEYGEFQRIFPNFADIDADK
ncbi:MAG: hypothetical protein OEM99_10540 [Gammaproteobacteria bacterium]|nr:hypothetical protein [Gammaproteobacteria bacterium]